MYFNTCDGAKVCRAMENLDQVNCMVSQFLLLLRDKNVDMKFHKCAIATIPSNCSKFNNFHFQD